MIWNSKSLADNIVKDLEGAVYKIEKNILLVIRMLISMYSYDITISFYPIL
jgi:hypothetical protein